jgi:hypothetical protein
MQMASIGLAEAARLTGRNQSTIHRAMKAGRLSYTVDTAGVRQVDTAELDRVFDLSSRKNGAAVAQPVQSNGAHAAELAALQRLLDDRDATIADLRRRLDLEAEERRRLTAVLTDRRDGDSHIGRRPWWRRRLRRSG